MSKVKNSRSVHSYVSEWGRRNDDVGILKSHFENDFHFKLMCIKLKIYYFPVHIAVQRVFLYAKQSKVDA